MSSNGTSVSRLLLILLSSPTHYHLIVAHLETVQRLDVRYPDGVPGDIVNDSRVFVNVSFTEYWRGASAAKTEATETTDPIKESINTDKMLEEMADLKVEEAEEGNSLEESTDLEKMAAEATNLTGE